MEWVLFVSLQWIVFGSPTQPTTQVIDSFPNEQLCNKPVGGQQRLQTVGRVVCFMRKDGVPPGR